MKKSIALIVIFLAMTTAVLSQTWQRTNGPATGEVCAMASDSSNVFVGTKCGGVFKSTDRGISWTNIGLCGLTIQSIFLDSANYIYCGLAGGGIFYSSNVGSTWQAASIFPAPTGSYNITGFVRVGWATYATTDIGIFRSTVPGYFTAYLLSNEPVHNFLVVGQYWFVTANGPLLRSSNLGTTWDTLTVTTGPNFFVSNTQLCQSRHNGAIFINTVNDGVYRSTDNGNSWVSWGNGMIIRSMIDGGGGKIYVAEAAGVRSFLDSVNSWEAYAGYPWSNSMLMATTLNVSPNGYLFAGTNRGIFRSTDRAANWTAMQNGFTNSQVLSFAQNEDFIFCGTREGLFRSADSGSNWEHLPDSTILWSPDINAMAIDNSGGLIIGNSTGAYRTTDNGATWSARDTTIPGVQSLAINHSNGYVFAGTTGGGIIRSTNNGVAWTHVYDTNFCWINSIAVNPVNGYVFAGLSHNGNSGVVRSTDNGDSWTYMGLNGLAINSIVISNSGRVVVGGSGGTNYLWFSTDNGITWSTPAYAINNVQTVFFDNENHLFLSTGSYASYLLRSDDYGTSWSFPMTGLANGLVNSFVQLADGRILAGTGGNGVFRTLNSTLGVSDNLISFVPTQYKLNQNYPNPFNPTTTILFMLPKASPVKLTVFDALGRQVQQLINSPMTVGSHSIQFDGSRLSSGVYFYRLQAGEFEKTQRMVLMK